MTWTIKNSLDLIQKVARTLAHDAVHDAIVHEKSPVLYSRQDLSFQSSELQIIVFPTQDSLNQTNNMSMFNARWKKVLERRTHVPSNTRLSQQTSSHGKVTVAPRYAPVGIAEAVYQNTLATTPNVVERVMGWNPYYCIERSSMTEARRQDCGRPGRENNLMMLY